MKPTSLVHPQPTRRFAIQAGAISLLGLGSAELSTLRAAPEAKANPKKSVIFVFLSGGIAQHESFDLKPNAPDAIRGEFKPIATKTPGMQICEHLPKLAERSEQFTLIRSLTHKSNEHSASHHIMLTGRSDLPIGFNASMPKPSDHPSLAAMAVALTAPRNNLPPAIVLPDKIVHNSGRVIPGQFAGVMGASRNPWFLEMSAFESKAYGAYPTHEFDHQERARTPKRKEFQTPDLTLPEGINLERFEARRAILAHLDQQRSHLEQAAELGQYDRTRHDAIALLTDRRVRAAFDLKHAKEADLKRYGKNAFGWSLLCAARLVEAGVNLVQVNLGNNETWDTHGNAFPHLKEKLLPPFDVALSGLFDDLRERGLFDSTLIVVCGEFGRTPKISTLTSHYKGPGRDHWGAVQSLLLAGGGVKGGNIIGSSDKNGAYPSSDPQTPENLSATIFQTLGLPSTTAWFDAENRPHHIYRGEPIRGLM